MEREKGDNGVKQNQEFPVKKIMSLAENDLQYQQLLGYYLDMEQYYRELSTDISQEKMETLEQYLAAGEALYYRFSQIAYQCGKRSRKK